MNIKISSNGLRAGTSVELEDGTKLSGVVSAEWKITVDEPSSAVLGIMIVPAELQGEGHFQAMHPITGRLHRVTAFIDEAGNTIELAKGASS